MGTNDRIVVLDPYEEVVSSFYGLIADEPIIVAIIAMKDEKRSVRPSGEVVQTEPLGHEHARVARCQI